MWGFHGTAVDFINKIGVEICVTIHCNGLKFTIYIYVFQQMLTVIIQEYSQTSFACWEACGIGKNKSISSYHQFPHQHEMSSFKTILNIVADVQKCKGYISKIQVDKLCTGRFNVMTHAFIHLNLSHIKAQWKNSTL